MNFGHLAPLSCPTWPARSFLAGLPTPTPVTATTCGRWVGEHITPFGLPEAKISHDSAFAVTDTGDNWRSGGWPCALGKWLAVGGENTAWPARATGIDKED